MATKTEREVSPQEPIMVEPAPKKAKVTDEEGNASTATAADSSVNTLVDASESNGEKKADGEVQTVGQASDSSGEAEKKETKAASGFAGFAGFASFKPPSGGSGFGSFSAGASSFGNGTSTSTSSSTGFTGGFGSTATTTTTTTTTETNDDNVTPKTGLTEAEIANGEEQEQIVIERRAKLFKLVEKDYVEVGIGPLRLLKAKETPSGDDEKKYTRIVMRRESYPRGPGTKLILNARLTACVSCVRRSEKALTLTVLETDEETQEDAAKVKSVTYLLRFGTIDEFNDVYKVFSAHIAVKVAQEAAKDSS